VSSMHLYAQKEYAHKVVDTLASPYMAGRGYVDDGCGKAARYISDQYKSMRLLPFGKSYEQPFHFPINTYPEQIEVSVNGKPSSHGADYIVIPVTPSIKGVFELVKFDKEILLDSIRLQNFLNR